jgi:F0F1-type ATP synthase assembly protein I
MQANGECVKTSFREILAESHISAVAIVVLLLWSLDSTVKALWGPLSAAARFLFTVVAILDIPYHSPALARVDRLMWIATGFNLFNASMSLAAAWLLSRWAYGVGPLRSLSKYRANTARRNHV